MEAFAGLIFGIIFAVAYLVAGAFMRRQAKKDVEEFVRRFPGRCFICSKHRWAYMEGFESLSNPPPHDCIEKMSGSGKR